MDDGPRDPETAAALLKLSHDQGIRQVALTSHFDCERMAAEEYLTRRAEAFEELKAALDGAYPDTELKLGAEIMYHPSLREENLRPLCLEGTDLLLLEFRGDQVPPFAEDLFLDLQAEGITPLIAHAERYWFLYRDPRILAHWISLGAFAQVNAAAVLGNDSRAQWARKLLKWNLAQVVASDAHSLQRRPPMLREAYGLISRKLGAETVRSLQSGADALFRGELPDIGQVHIPRQILGKWL